MIRYSVLVLDRGISADTLRRQIRSIADVLARLGEPHEIIGLHFGPGSTRRGRTNAQPAESDDRQNMHLPAGSRLGEALTTGIARARGEMVIVLEAGLHYEAEEIPRLLERLTRADLVCGKRPRRGLAKLWQRVARVPRWLMLGLEVRDPACLYWAGRREAIARLDLSGGLYRYVATLVAARGFRVDELPVDDARRWWWEPVRPSALVTAWRLARLYREHVRERMRRAGGEALAANKIWRDSAEMPASMPSQRRRAA